MTTGAGIVLRWNFDHRFNVTRFVNRTTARARIGEVVLSRRSSQVPIESVLFSEYELLYRRMCGTISIEEIEADNEALFANPYYITGTNVIIDDNRVMDFDFGFTEMFEFVRRANDRLGARQQPLHIFFVGDRVMGRSVAKMFKAFSQTRASVMKVHTEMDMEEALTFVDAPLSVMEHIKCCNIPLNIRCAPDVPCDLPRCAGLKRVS